MYVMYSKWANGCMPDVLNKACNPNDGMKSGCINDAHDVTYMCIVAYILNRFYHVKTGLDAAHSVIGP